MISRPTTSSLIVGGSASLAACLVAVTLVRPLLNDSTDGVAAPLPVASISILETTPETTLGTTPETTLDTVRNAGSTESVNLEAFGASDLDLDAARRQTVAVTSSVGLQHLATGLVWGDHIVTSAAALGDQTRFKVRINDRWEFATVIGVDHFTDVALLTRPRRVAHSIENEVVADEAIETQNASETEPAPVSFSVSTATDNSEDDATATLAIDAGSPIAILASDAAIEPHIGRLLGGQHDVSTLDGRQAVGVWLTSVRMDPSLIGAPAINANGDLLGMTIASDGSLAAIVPMKQLETVAASLLSRGWARTLWMGIEGVDLEPGIELVSITADSPAFAAGLRPGDVVHRIDETATPHMAALIRQLRTMATGDRAMVIFERDGRALTTTIEMAEYGDAAATSEPTEVSEPISG